MEGSFHPIFIFILVTALLSASLSAVGSFLSSKLLFNHTSLFLSATECARNIFLYISSISIESMIRFVSISVAYTFV